MSALSILQLAGFTLDFEDTSEPACNGLYAWMLDVAASVKSDEELAEVLRSHKRKIAST